MVGRLVIILMLLLITLPAVWAQRVKPACQPQAAGTGREILAATCEKTGTSNTISFLNTPGDNSKMKNTVDTNVIHHPHFLYEIRQPANPSGDVVVLLHGSGGDETTLFPFAGPIWPRAVLVGVRGRVVQNGETRWYRKISPTRFDEKDVEHETDALVRFLTDLAEKKQYDVSRITFAGYSNGANLLAVMMLKHPDFVRRAVLMRSMPVLDNMPGADLRKARVLTISGSNDVLYSPFAPALSSLLRMKGAKVESHMIESDHMIGEDDGRIVARWVANQDPESISALPRTKPGK